MPLRISAGPILPRTPASLARNERCSAQLRGHLLEHMSMFDRSLSRISWSVLAAATFLVLEQPVLAEAPVPKEIDFNRDIRPILSDNCYACHGPDKNKRKADLRLDTQDGHLLPTIEDRHVDRARASRSRASCSGGSPRTIPTSGCPTPRATRRLSDREIARAEEVDRAGGGVEGHWAYLKPVQAAACRRSDDAGVRAKPDRPFHPGAS